MSDQDSDGAKRTSSPSWMIPVMVALIGALATIIAAWIARPPRPVDNSTPAQPTLELQQSISSTVVAAPSPALTPTTTPVYRYDFAPSSPSWNDDPSVWRTVEVENGRYAYEGRSSSDHRISGDPPDKMAMIDLQDYRLDLRARVVEQVSYDDELSDGWIAIRHDDRISSGCSVNDIYFNTRADQVTLSTGGDDACPFEILDQRSVRLEANTWYTFSVSALGDHITVQVNNEPVIDADGIEPRTGFFYLNVAPGAAVQFADIRMWEME